MDVPLLIKHLIQVVMLVLSYILLISLIGPRGSVILSKIDLAQSSHQVHIDKACKHRTSFQTRFRLF